MDNKLKIKVCKRAFELHHIDFAPYSLCVCMKYALREHMEDTVHTISEVPKYIPEFYDNRPHKKRDLDEHWWAKKDKDSRTEYMEELIKQLKDDK